MACIDPGGGLFSAPGCPGSIVSATTFHFRVRNENGWGRRALTTRKSIISIKRRYAQPPRGLQRRVFSNQIRRERVLRVPGTSTSPADSAQRDRFVERRVRVQAEQLDALSPREAVDVLEEPPPHPDPPRRGIHPHPLQHREAVAALEPSTADRTLPQIPDDMERHPGPRAELGEVRAQALPRVRAAGVDAAEVHRGGREQPPCLPSPRAAALVGRRSVAPARRRPAPRCAGRAARARPTHALPE